MVSTRSAAAAATADAIPRVPLLGVIPQLESLDSEIERRSHLYREAALRHRATSPAKTPHSRAILTLPTILTLARVAMVPLLAAGFFSPHPWAPAATAAIFILAALTDWLDGYLARRMRVVSEFGAFLDPVADKIMVSTALVLLAAAPPPPVTVAAMAGPVSIIIARELIMSALREWAATAGGAAHSAVKVSSLGKWKTALQMISMAALLLFRCGAAPLVALGVAPVNAERAVAHGAITAWVLLLGATALALWSLARYIENAWEHFVDAHHSKKL